MIGDILSFLGKATGLVDDLVTSDEERLQLKGQLAQAYGPIVQSALEHESVLVKAQRDAVVAEAGADSWLTRSWRPLVMITFTALIVVGQLGGPEVPEQMWPLLKLGLGGYVVGRSGEKITTGVVQALKERDS